MPTLALPISNEVSARVKGEPLVLLLDIDGTLAPIAPRPQDAVVPIETKRVLDDLAHTPGVHVVFVTGRAAVDGRRLAGVDDAYVIGNHGLELALPRQAPEPRSDVAPFIPRIAEASARIAALAAERGWSGVFAEDKRLSLSTHYRLASRAVVPELSDAVAHIGNELGLRVTHGKEVLEVRPPIAANKGTAAMELAESLSAMHASASLLAAGDDRTDEDMFRVLRAQQPRAVTVRVGAVDQETAAEFIVSDVDDVRTLLASVLAARRNVPS